MCLLPLPLPLPLSVFGFFVDEPFLVYQMTAGRCSLAGCRPSSRQSRAKTSPASESRAIRAQTRHLCRVGERRGPRSPGVDRRRFSPELA